MKNTNQFNSMFLKPIYLPMVMFLFMSLIGNAQTKLELSIGDPAPPLRYSKWIKGTPTEDFSGNKLYILEFWATWCKPCIEAMPHLSELAQKYSEKMKVIAVNVSERSGNEPYESVLPKVEEFVSKNKENMKFDVMVDNNNRDMSNNWLRKGNIVGIPATIIIKDSKIIWIGHPLFLDAVLIEIFEDKYDMLAKKKTYEKDILASMAARNKYNTKMTVIDSALNAKNYPAALKAVNKVIAEEPNAFTYKLKKLQILLAHFDVKQVTEFLENTTKLNQSHALGLADYIANQNKIPKEYDLAAIKLINESFTVSSYYLDRLAFLQSRVGDFREASITQQRALEILRRNASAPSSKITPDVLVQFEEKVKQYQQAAKK